MKRLFLVLLVAISVATCGTENNKTFILSTSVSPADKGSINEVNGEYSEGEFVALSATPIDGWKFAKWDGGINSIQNPHQLKMDRDYTISAVFERREYPLTIEIVGNGEVQEVVIPQRTTDYSFETVVELTPIPAEGWEFVEWGRDLNGNEVPTTINVDGEKTVTAKFILKQYSVVQGVTGQGSIEMDPELESYDHGSDVTFTAVPENGWAFVKWSGDVDESTNPLTKTILNSLNIIAEFQRKNYPLTIEIVGNGEVQEVVIPQRTTEYSFETVVELTPIADEGWEFVEWSGDLTGRQVPSTIKIEREKTVTARFKLKEYPVEFEVVGQGTVELDPASDLYDHGSEVSMSAIPASGWEFVKWSGDINETTTPYSITVLKPMSVVAEFQRKEYPLTIEIVGNGEVQEVVIPQRTTDYSFETLVELTPIPAEGWDFVEWSGDISGNDSPVEISITGSMSITATFRLKQYSLEVNTEGSGNVVIDSVQEFYNHGTTVNLTAIPADGWDFNGWTGDRVESDATIQIEFLSDVNLTAKFERIDFDLNLVIEGEGEVFEEVITARRTAYPFESSVRLSSKPSDGWFFYEWSGDLSGDENPATIQMNTNKSITTVFKDVNEFLNLETNGEGRIVLYQEAYSIDKSRRNFGVRAVPENGWEFTGWGRDLSGVENNQRIIIDGSQTSNITANFKRIPYRITMNKTGNGTISVSPSKDIYHYGDEVTFSANPSNGSIFSGWSGSFNSSSVSYTTTVTSNMEVNGLFKTVEELLVYQFTGGTFINSRVYGASLTLRNNLPGTIILRKFALLNSNQSQLTSAKDDILVARGNSVSYSISFGIAPTEATFSNYYAVWVVEYEGKEYTKKTRVGYFGSVAKDLGEGNVTVEIEVD
jgi:hypothetical protein